MYKNLLKYLLKNLIVLLLFSLAVLFGLKHIQPLVLFLVSARDWVSQALLPFIAGGELATTVRNLLALLFLPFFIGAIPTIIFWMSKRRMFPYFMHVVWVVWLLQTTAIVVLSPVAA